MSLPDRVKETTTSTGTGNITLLGAVGQFQPLSAAFTASQTGITLCIADQSGLNWEVSSCTYINSTTISRDTVLSSSNAGSLVNFGAGVKDVFYTLSAADIAKLAGAASAAATTIAETATSKMLIVESGVPKQITVDNFLASVGQTSGALTAAGALAGSNIIVISQDGGTTEVRTTLTALAAYVASTLTPATAVTMSGPSSGTTGTASTNFSIAANGTISGTVIVTPSDAANGGTFTPTTVSISSASPTATFTYTPGSTGAKTISVTNNGSLTNPANITYTSNAAAATAATMSGPTSGTTGVASTNFTAGANGGITGTVIITPSDAANGGTFTPTTVSISSASPTATFTYTPGSTGAKTISITNNSGLTNPASITYTSNAASSPAYLFSPTAYAFPASGANISTNGYAGATSCDIYIKTAAGVTPANVKMCFDKSSTVPPTTYAHAGNIANPNDIKTCTRTGGWTQGGSTGQSFYGLYGLGGASLFAYGTAGDYYLWILTDDGFSKCYDNNTGTPVKWTLV